MAEQAGPDYATYDERSAVVRRMDIRLTNTSPMPVTGTFVMGKSRNPFVPGWFALPGVRPHTRQGLGIPQQNLLRGRYEVISVWKWPWRRE